MNSDKAAVYREGFEAGVVFSESKLEEAKEIIRDCQSLLACYLPPDSGITPQQCISDLLDILDGPRARSFLRENSNG